MAHNRLQDLIDALTILRKYGNPVNPTMCEHDVMHINGVYPSDVSDEDKAQLEKLGFESSMDNVFYSNVFGSA